MIRTVSHGIILLSMLYILSLLSLYWTHPTLCTPFTNSNSIRNEPLPRPDSNHGDNSYEDYIEAFYLDDQPDFRVLERSYAEENLKTIRANKNIPRYNMPFIDQSQSLMVNHTNQHPILSGLRLMHDPMIRQTTPPACMRYRFNISKFPAVSIIMPFQNERPGMLAMTIHSLLARTPPQILHEIIIVDDNGELPEERDGIDEQEIKHLKSLPKVKWIAHQQKQGCAGSRLSGARIATAPVLVFIDSHIEMYTSQWAEHLLLPILQNRRTLAMQQLNTIDDQPGHNRKPMGSHQSFGTLNDKFIFTYQRGRFDGQEYPHPRIPEETVFAPGSLFAIRRDEFWRLGGYDTGLAVWGGENIELALKVWRCGFDGKGPPGRIVVVPCSTVGHVYRIHHKELGRWPPPLPNYVLQRFHVAQNNATYRYRGLKSSAFNQIVVRNNLRILKVWIGQDHYVTKRYYHSGFGKFPNETLAPEWQYYVNEMNRDPEIQRQVEIQRRNKCKSFDWFDRHVFFKYLGRHNPFHDSEWGHVSCGQHRAESCSACPQGHGKTWCNGDCHWCMYGSANSSNQCVLKDVLCHRRPPPISNNSTTSQ